MRTMTATMILVLAGAAPAGEPANPAARPLTEAERAEVAARFPANQWVELNVKVEIPKPWDAGRHVSINSFGSVACCEALGEVLAMDGYAAGVPAGKNPPNNYSDSLYGFNPMTGVYRLVKRSNWRAGARSKAPEICSYPLDENRDEPTPCPRHTYNGICFSPEDGKFYLINGANAGVPNEHPKFKTNGGTSTDTFWAYDVATAKWSQLEYPGVRRKEPFETVLRAVPGTGTLYLFGSYALASYDLKTGQWKVLIDEYIKDAHGAVGGFPWGSRATVDARRGRVLFHGGRPWRATGGKAAELAMGDLVCFDARAEKFRRLTGKGVVPGEPGGGLAYVDHLDRCALRTEHGLFLLDPETESWARAEVSPPVARDPRRFGYSYMVYDMQRELLLLDRGNTWAGLRLDAGTLKMKTGDPAGREGGP